MLISSQKPASDSAQGSPNPDSFKQTREFARSVITFGVTRLPGTNRVFLAGSDFKVAEWDLSAEKPEARDLYAHESYVTSVTLAGTTLVSGGYDGHLHWWDTKANKTIRSEHAHGKWIRKVVSSPDGSQVVSVADDMLTKVWDAKTGKLQHTLKGHQERTPHHFPSMLYVAAFSSDGKHLATVDKVGHIVVWDAATGKQLQTMETPGMYTWDPVQRRHSIGGPRALAFSGDGKNLVVGGIGKIGNIDHLDGKARIEMFDWQAGKSTWVFESDKYKGLINCLRFAPKGEWLLGVGGAAEGFYFFFDITEKKVLRQDKVAMHVHDLHINPKGDSLILAGHNKVLHYEMSPRSA